MMLSLSDAVVEVLSGTLLHQRHRWGPLMGHRNAFEGWWKGEFTQALENWCWSTPGFDPVEFGVRVEAHPRAFGVPSCGDCRIDLLLAPWNRDGGNGAGLATNEGPRVWVEIKDRGTWWGGDGPLAGLKGDIKKLESIDWTPHDTTLAVLVLRHDGEEEDVLPGGKMSDWAAAVHSVAGSRRVLVSPCVGYPLPVGPGENGHVRWAQIFVVEVYTGA